MHTFVNKIYETKFLQSMLFRPELPPKLTDNTLQTISWVKETLLALLFFC